MEIRDNLMEKNLTISARDDLYHAKTYARQPLVITSGKGSLVYDENGKEAKRTYYNEDGSIKL